MISETLSLWENGAVTLPKEWRERYGTKHFLAKENEKGYLVIMPIVDTEYYEAEDGTCELRFPMGIEPGRLASMMDDAMREIASEKRAKKTSGSH